MKIHQAILIFLMIFIAITLNYDTKQKTLDTISTQNQRFSGIFETAVNDAAESLVIRDGGSRPYLQKEEAVQVFFQSLYAGFGVMHDQTAQTDLTGCIPIILITDIDGYYFYYMGEYEENGRNVGYVWSEKIPYATYLSPETDSEYLEGTDSDSNTNTKAYYVGVTLEDTLYLQEEGSSQVYYQTRSDLSESHPNLAILKSESVYEEFRRETITNHIVESMACYINICNRIGERYQLNYEFSIPYLDDSDWARTIDDVSFVAFFQGYPYGDAVTETYNKVILAGARVKKKAYYYITYDGEQYYYHRDNCSSLSEKSAAYETKRQCAQLGAYPCPECMP